MKTLRSNFENIIELLYKFNDTEETCRLFLDNKIYNNKIESIFNNLNQIIITINIFPFFWKKDR